MSGHANKERTESIEARRRRVTPRHRLTDPPRPPRGAAGRGRRRGERAGVAESARAGGLGGARGRPVRRRRSVRASRPRSACPGAARPAIRAASPRAVAGFPPGPCVYTGGLENHPDVIDAIARDRPLAGNAADVVRGGARSRAARRCACARAGLRSRATRLPTRWACPSTARSCQATGGRRWPGHRAAGAARPPRPCGRPLRLAAIRRRRVAGPRRSSRRPPAAGSSR